MTTSELNHEAERRHVARPANESFRATPDLVAQYGELGKRSGQPPRAGNSGSGDGLVFTSVYDRNAASSFAGRDLDVGRTSFDQSFKAGRLSDAARILDRPLDVPLEAGPAKAKEDFADRVRKRYEHDPEKMRAVLRQLDQMDQRVLHQKDIKDANGDVVIGAKERQAQLEKAYKNLSRISDNAENLTYETKDGRIRHVYSKGDVDTLLASTICHAGDPKRFFNQGKTNCCAADSINGQNALLLAGNYTEHIADLCTQGIYRGKDRTGNTVEVPVDRASLRLTGSAKAFSMEPGNFESAADRVGNTGLAQFNLALYAMDQGLPPDTYKYLRTSPRSRTDTGERVVVTHNVMADGQFFRRGQVIANSPIFTAENISRTKQAAFGYEIDGDFGKRTTLVSRPYANGDNATVVHDGGQLNDQLRQLRAQGIDDATLVSHTGNYYHKARGQGGSGICGRSAGGLHATRVGMNDDGTLHWTGSWGGVDNRASMSGDEMASWMKPPPTLLAGGGRTMPLVFPMPFERSLPLGSSKWQDFMPHFEENRDLGKREVAAKPLEEAPAEPRLPGTDRNKHDLTMAGLRQEIYEAHQKLAKLRSELAALRDDSGDRASFVSQEFDLAGRLAEFQFRLKGIG